MGDLLGQESWIPPNVESLILIGIAIMDTVIIYYMCEGRNDKRRRHIYNEGIQEILPLPEMNI